MVILLIFVVPQQKVDKPTLKKDQKGKKFMSIPLDAALDGSYMFK